SEAERIHHTGHEVTGQLALLGHRQVVHVAAPSVPILEHRCRVETCLHRHPRCTRAHLAIAGPDVPALVPAAPPAPVVLRARGGRAPLPSPPVLGGASGFAILPGASPGPGLRNTIACWPICQRLEITKYTTTPAAMLREMKPKTIGKILPIIWAWGFWAACG